MAAAAAAGAAAVDHHHHHHHHHHASSPSPQCTPASIFVFDPSAHAYNNAGSDTSSSGSSGYPTYLSAGGGLQATRLAAADEGRAYVASHSDVYEMQVTYPSDENDNDDDDDPPDRPQQQRPRGAQQPFAGVRVRRLPSPPKVEGAGSGSGAWRKPAELQSLALHPTDAALLAGVDARQGLLLHRLRPSEEAMEQQQEETLPPVSSSYLPFQLPPGEDGGEFGGFGWAGLALDPQRPQRVATVRAYGKMLAWTDIEAASPTTAPLQVHRLWQPPAALAYIHTAASHDPLLAVAEGPAFSLWDARTPGGCIAREQPAPPTRLHALAGLGGLLQDGGNSDVHDRLLLVAGDDGVLIAYDLRCLGGTSSSSSSGNSAPLRIRARWRSAVKHGVVALVCTPSFPSRVYAAGLDSELFPCTLPPVLLAGGGCGSGDKGGGKGGGKQQRQRRKRRLGEEDGGEGVEEEKRSDPPPHHQQQQQHQRQQQQAQAASHAPLPPTSRLHEAHHASMRADARWVGVALAPGGGKGGGGDTVLGVSDRGTLYAVRHAEGLGASWRLGGGGGGGD